MRPCFIQLLNCVSLWAGDSENKHLKTERVNWFIKLKIQPFLYVLLLSFKLFLITTIQPLTGSISQGRKYQKKNMETVG
jgi:hypothetical protein